MASEMAGKVAIVTGAAKGIGAATAEVFVEEGAHVVIADIDAAHGEALAARLGPNARFRNVSVDSREAIQDLVDYTVAEFGGLHVMMNNAAMPGKVHNRFLDDDLSDFAQVVNLDLASVMHGSQIAARHMKENGGGSIINVASIAALAPSYGLLTYRAAKSGVMTFSKAIAIDFGEYNIRVNCIAPGHIPTAMNSMVGSGLSEAEARALQDEMDALLMVNQPLKRQGSPRDVANTALFLASDRSAQVSGQVIAVDGGITAGDAINLFTPMTQARERFFADRAARG